MATTTHVARGGPAVGGTADTSFTHGTGQVDADIVIEWDFDNDGDFDQAIEDTTGYLMSLETMTGRDFPSGLTGHAVAGQLRATYLNNDDRFNYFNTASPLATDPYSLRVGRKLRVRTSDATTTDPALLVSDRFNRPDGLLGTTETGQDWGATDTSAFAIENEQATARFVDIDGTFVEQTFDTGAGASFYVQVAVGDLYSSNRAGIVMRRSDANNRLQLMASSSFLILTEFVAGIENTLGSYSLSTWPGMTIGLKTEGTTVTAYLSGVPVITATFAVTGGDGIAGLGYYWIEAGAPTFDDFHVWEDITSEIDGVLWTGDMADLRTTVELGPHKIAEVAGEGQLARLALPDIVSSRARSGAFTGVLVGDTLAKAGLLHPPGVIAEGTVETGPVTLEDGNALAMAQEFEETELGFLHEMNEGPIAFHDRVERATASVAAVFSDEPGAQFNYARLAPLDQRRDIVNRVTAGVAPEEPGWSSSTGVTTRFSSTAAGVANHVDVLLPTTAAGDLLVVFIASTVRTSGVGWHRPIWWQSHRELGTQDDDENRTRVYSHICDGTESGTTVRFYTDSGPAGGVWEALIVRVTDWFEATAGIAVTEFVSGDDPPAIVHGWGRQPSLFLAVNAGLGSTSGGSYDTDEARWPDGYFVNGGVVTGTTDAFDVGLFVAGKLAVAESDDPTTFAGLTGFTYTESVTVAVRGYNGPHVVLPTLKNPSQFQESPGRFVTVQDHDSQREHRMVRSHASPSNLFANETDAEAYGDVVLASYADDRPVFEMSFYPTLNAAYRMQAVRRRVGHKIRLVANSDTGMGVDGDFFIESINHRWSDAGKHWETTWQLSPA